MRNRVSIRDSKESKAISVIKAGLMNDVDGLDFEGKNWQNAVASIKDILIKSQNLEKYDFFYALINKKIRDKIPLKEKYNFYKILAQMESSEEYENARLPKSFTYDYGSFIRPNNACDFQQNIASFFAKYYTISTAEKSLNLLLKSKINTYPYQEQTIEFITLKTKKLEELLGAEHKDYNQIAQIITTVGQDITDKTLKDERVIKETLLNTISGQLKTYSEIINKISEDENLGKEFITRYLEENPLLISHLSKTLDSEEVTNAITKSTAIIKPLASIIDLYYRDTAESLAQIIIEEARPSETVYRPTIDQKSTTIIIPPFPI